MQRLTLQKRAELRRFSAEESIRLAEQKLQSQIGVDADASSSEQAFKRSEG